LIQSTAQAAIAAHIPNPATAVRGIIRAPHRSTNRIGLSGPRDADFGGFIGRDQR
jgi:hypothetical protein